MASVLDQLIQELSQRNGGGNPSVGFRATPSTPSTPYYTGPGGLFGVAGLEQDIISSRVQPMGLADRLPAIGTNVVNPLFAYLTGFQASSGANPEGVCDDPPTVGAGKSCIQTAQFGRYSYQTRTLEFDRLGEQMNRGEFLDLRFLNDPLLTDGAMTVPGSIPGQAGLSREALMRFIELGVEFQSKLGRQVYEGNPANNTGGSGYQEFPGLDILIGTGKIDALTQTACPALDSDIKNAAYARVDTNGAFYMNLLSSMARYLRYNAQNMNFGNTEWVLVMRPDLFWEMTAIWACAYLSYRCNLSGNNTNFIDSAEAVRFRDDMRNGNYLMIDGLRYNVVLDSMIREETNTTGPANVISGCYASDIYFVPLTVRGGVPVTYWEHKDYMRNMALMQDARMPANFFWTDSGRYAWHFKPPTNWCLQWMAKIEPRIILRTPQLAGRITNAMYCPTQHTRDVLTTDPYFMNGGQTSARTTPSLFADWGTVTP